MGPTSKGEVKGEERKEKRARGGGERKGKERRGKEGREGKGRLSP